MAEVQWRGQVVVGVIGGLIGGVLMAIFSMSMSVMRGPGMWMPVKLIGGFVLGPSAINEVEAFDFTPIASGLLIHMVVSAVLGGLFGALASKLPDVTVALYGVVYALAIWFVALFFVLPIVDPLLVNNTNPVLFAVSHIIYGVSVGWWISTRS
jgi:hypothetical protein